MAVIEIAKIQIRRGQELQTGIPRLDPGEMAWAEDTERLWIGKRIVEGANTDENTEIITRPYLDSFIRSLSTSSGIYQYRADALHIDAEQTTVATKLDNFVSLTDYGVTINSDPIDIWYELDFAIQNLFNNFTKEEDARRTLIIPAGTYYVSDSVKLPPYASLAGEGPDLTTLVFTKSSDSLFKTSDGNGNVFEGTMESGNTSSRYVHLENLTLAYNYSISNNSALLSLDNCENALVKNVKFITTGTNQVQSTGIGIELRGQRAAGVEQAKNINIIDCEFKALALGIKSTGTVINVNISDSNFHEIKQGININTISPIQEAPKNFVIQNNKFERIENEAIFVGTSTNAGFHQSIGNIFKDVGNGLSAGHPVSDDLVTSSKKSVIAFYSDGNSSTNDIFNRRTVATTATGSFYYNPLVIGTCSADNNQVSTATVASSATTEIIKVPLNGKDQMITMRYMMFDSNYSRKGRLILNIVGADASTSISDYYDYSYVNPITDPTFDADTTYSSNGYIMLKSNNSGSTSTFKFEYQTDIIV